VLRLGNGFTIGHKVHTPTKSLVLAIKQIGEAAGLTPAALPSLINCPSEKIRDSRISGDACCCNHTDNVCDLGSRGVVRIQGERTAIVLPILTQRDLLKDPSRTRWVADSTRRISCIVS
jgi:hypothetical protein